MKGPDLCFLDQPGAIDDARSRAVREVRRPAGAVRERAVLRAVQGRRLLAQHAAVERGAARTTCTPLTWGLREVLQYAEVLLNKDDVDAKADALIDFIRERVVDRDFSDAHARQQALSRAVVRRSRGSGSATCCRPWRAKDNEGWRTHHVATIRKVRNRLSNISTRCAGLVTDDGTVSDLPFGSFQDRTVYVIDVASLEEDAQDLIFARVVTKLREHLEKRDLGVNHVDRVRRRAEQVRAERWPGHLRPENAARPRRARPVSRSRAVQRAAVPVAGPPARRRQFRNGAVRPHGRRRAGDAGLRGAQPGGEDQARDAGEGAADGAASALHAADLRSLSAAGHHARPRRRRAVSAGGRTSISRRRCCAVCAPSIRITLGWVQDAIGIREDEEV